MAATPEFTAFARDLFSGLGPVKIRRMFGGAGVYLDEAMFALISDDTLYMRTDAALGEAYAKAGSEQWTYDGKGKPVTMPYWRLPDAALDDPEVAVDWARRSLIPAEAVAAEKRAAAVRKKARSKKS